MHSIDERRDICAFMPALVPISEEAIHAISQIAAEILIDHRDDNLVRKLTIVKGYAELLASQPKNLTYRLILQRAAASMVELMRRRRLGEAELTDRLEKILGSDHWSCRAV